MLPFLYVKETGFTIVILPNLKKPAMNMKVSLYLHKTDIRFPITTVGKTKPMSGSSFTMKNALSAIAEGAFFIFFATVSQNFLSFSSFLSRFMV